MEAAREEADGLAVYEQSLVLDRVVHERQCIILHYCGISYYDFSGSGVCGAYVEEESGMAISYEWTPKSSRITPATSSSSTSRITSTPTTRTTASSSRRTTSTPTSSP